MTVTLDNNRDNKHVISGFKNVSLCFQSLLF